MTIILCHDDTHLEKLVNLIDEHLALYDTSLKEYKTASEMETFGQYSRSYGC